MSDQALLDVKPRLMELIRSFPDFPKKGILFRDIMPLFTEPRLVQEFCQAVAEHCKCLKPPVEAVAGLEARGFLFGPQIAAELNVPFIPLRKKGKLPGSTVQTVYEKEYGKDAIEVQQDAISQNMNVFLFDDLLATGGTMKGAIELVRLAGGRVSEAFCIVELTDLKGRQVLDSGIPVYTLIKY